jgi:hypothetical protein
MALGSCTADGLADEPEASAGDIGRAVLLVLGPVECEGVSITPAACSRSRTALRRSVRLKRVLALRTDRVGEFLRVEQGSLQQRDRRL